MTQQDKDLLLRDLSARLTYGAKVFIQDITGKYSTITERTCDTYVLQFLRNKNTLIKPYLRPMSNMTEEEFKKLKEYSGLVYDQLDLASFQDGAYKCLDFYLSEVPSYVVILVFDWLNAHHFDYRGLIEKGLALEAPEGMYNLEKK